VERNRYGYHSVTVIIIIIAGMQPKPVPLYAHHRQFPCARNDFLTTILMTDNKIFQPGIDEANKLVNPIHWA
jgi:hypothetical protein